MFVRQIQTRPPLSVADKNTFFETHGHLNYRYTMLWRHKTAEDSKTHGPKITLAYADAICDFESALIVCRVFMEFLGLSAKHTANGPVLVEKPYYQSFDGVTTDEVKVIDLGGTYATLSSVTASESEILAAVYYMAHKATAHFTFGAMHMRDPAMLHRCIPIVDRLLHKHLFDKIGIRPHQHGA
jgi:hypothetical protein